MAFNNYVRKTNIINDPPPIPSVKPKGKPKKAAVVEPVPVVVTKIKKTLKKVVPPVPIPVPITVPQAKQVIRNTREQAIANVVKAMVPDVRRSTRAKEFITKRRGDHVIILGK